MLLSAGFLLESRLGKSFTRVMVTVVLLTDVVPATVPSCTETVIPVEKLPDEPVLVAGVKTIASRMAVAAAAVSPVIV